MIRLLVLLVLLSACSSRPVVQLALSDAALKAAQRAKADKLAPDLYRKAENHHLRAKKDYREGYFDSAQKYADEARKLSEQAEYEALLKQSKIGSNSGNLRPY